MEVSSRSSTKLQYNVTARDFTRPSSILKKSPPETLYHLDLDQKKYKAYLEYLKK